MVLMFAFFQNPYVDFESPKMIVFGGGNFGRCLGYEGGVLKKALVPL